MKLLKITLILISMMLTGISIASSCPDLRGRFLCEGLFGQIVHEYDQRQVAGVTEYDILTRTRRSKYSDIIITDNQFRVDGPFESRNWCEGDELKRFLTRGWDNRTQTHDVTVFINMFGDLERHDLAKSFENGELQSQKLHKEVCPRL